MRSQAELERLFDALDTVMLDGGMAARNFKIRWRKFRKTQCFVYGRIYFHNNTIVINRILARPEVPTFVLMGTIWHEMVHAVVGHEHDSAFKMAEMRYVHFAACAAWEAENIDRLIAEEP